MYLNFLSSAPIGFFMPAANMPTINSILSNIEAGQRGLASCRCHSLRKIRNFKEPVRNKWSNYTSTTLAFISKDLCCCGPVVGKLNAVTNDAVDIYLKITQQPTMMMMMTRTECLLLAVVSNFQVIPDCGGENCGLWYIVCSWVGSVFFWIIKGPGNWV